MSVPQHTMNNDLAFGIDFLRDSGSYNAFIKQLKFYECVGRRTATAGRFAPLDAWEMPPPHVSTTQREMSQVDLFKSNKLTKFPKISDGKILTPFNPLIYFTCPKL